MSSPVRSGQNVRRFRHIWLSWARPGSFRQFTGTNVKIAEPEVFHLVCLVLFVQSQRFWQKAFSDFVNSTGRDEAGIRRSGREICTTI